MAGIQPDISGCQQNILQKLNPKGRKYLENFLSRPRETDTIKVQLCKTKILKTQPPICLDYRPQQTLALVRILLQTLLPKWTRHIL